MRERREKGEATKTNTNTNASITRGKSSLMDSNIDTGPWWTASQPASQAGSAPDLD